MNREIVRLAAAICADNLADMGLETVKKPGENGNLFVKKLVSDTLLTQGNMHSACLPTACIVRREDMFSQGSFC